jgi:hypothetical protein
MNIVGALSANEIRSLEDMNSYDGGDKYFVQMNMQTVENALTAPPQAKKPISNGSDKTEE